MRMVFVMGFCAALLAGCGIFDGPGMWEQQQTSMSSRQTASMANPLPVTTLGQLPDTPQGQGQGAKDDATCRSYGTYPGTTPYVQCRLGLKKMADERADEETPFGTLFGN